ncbi:MAG: hypothetical protein ACI88G_002420 [Woeseiaceae bacterium]|jgi:hypothetical protein
MTVEKMKSAAILAAIGLAGMISACVESAGTPLEGAWIVSSWENLDGETIADPQPGLFIFTSTNYSIMYVNTADERPQYDADAGQTDGEILAAYDSLTANSGGYEIDGNVFTTYAYVAKDNNFMGGFPENGTDYEFERDGDNLIITTLTFPEAFKVILESVEGQDGPWETDAAE